MVKKAFVSWSGGKDCSFAMYKSAGDGYEVAYLINMLQEDGLRCAWHKVRAETLKAQADALGVAIIQEKTTHDRYENDFKRVCKELKKDGVEYGVFGDIDLQEHRDWVERVCGEVGIRAIFPLWMQNQHQIMSDFIRAGFKALIVTIKSGLNIEGFLGSYIDEETLSGLVGAGVTPCGEKGEFHTIVTDGVNFKKELKVLSGRKRAHGDYEFFDIDKFAFINKE